MALQKETTRGERHDYCLRDVDMIKKVILIKYYTFGHTVKTLTNAMQMVNSNSANFELKTRNLASRKQTLVSKVEI